MDSSAIDSSLSPLAPEGSESAQPPMVASSTGLGFSSSADTFQRIKHKLSVITAKLTGASADVVEEEEVLRLLRRDLEDVDVEEFWQNMTYDELATWSLRELKIACAARRLDQSGRKLDLIDRLMQRKLKEAKIRERARLRDELNRQRENEADGAVYCCGVGYGPQCSTWDRLQVRNNLTLIQALAGIGVVTVTVGVDSTLCYGLCANGEIWSWGTIRSDERAPVGYARKLVFQPQKPVDMPTYQHGRMTKFKVGSTPVGLPATPIRLPIRDAKAAQETEAQEAKRARAIRAARIAGTPLPDSEEAAPPKEQPWVTEQSVRDAEAARAARAEEDRKRRVKERRLKMISYKKSGYELEPLPDDDGRPDAELLSLDTGMDTIDPKASFPTDRLPKANERPGILSGAPGQRLTNFNKSRPPPAIDEGKSWMSLSMGKLASSMKSLALEAVKATPFGDYLDNTPEEQAKMDQKYGSGALAEPAKPPVVDMIVRTVPDNADWDDVKHKAVLFGPLDEHRRTIIGADEWHEFKDLTSTVAEEMIDRNFCPPMPIESLTGEIPVAVIGSSTHALAISKGGDVFTWGSPESGMLGLGAAANSFVDAPTLMHYIPADKIITGIAAGLNHTACVSSDGELFVWGFPLEGRLGLGNVTAFGPTVEMMHPDRRSGIKAGPTVGVTVPVSVSFFSVNKIMVKSVVCGVAHTMAITLKGVFSWGCNDGGRLGLGDNRNRDMPCEIIALRGKVVLDISAGGFHSAALVLIPPLLKGGWVFTWGTGLFGQLGHGNVNRVSLLPKLVEELVDREVVISKISCGMLHTAALSEDHEVWTWGKNDSGCLGRPGSIRDVGEPEFSGIPGRMETLREYGIGPVISVACGNRTTVIATAPFRPLLPFQVRDRARLDLAREAQSQRLYELSNDEKRRAEEEAASKRRKERLLELNMSRPLCSTCYKCKGFIPTLFRPMVCDLCGHDRKAHTKHRILHPDEAAKRAAAGGGGGH